MANTTEINTSQSAFSKAEQWVSDSAAHIWQNVKDDPLSTIGAAAAIGVAGFGAGTALTLKLCRYGAKSLLRRELMETALSRSVQEELGTAAGARQPWANFPGSSMISDPALNRYVTAGDRLAGMQGGNNAERIAGITGRSSLPEARSFGPNKALASEPPSPLFMKSNDSFAWINEKRMDTLLDMNARSRLSTSEYLAQLSQRTKVEQVNANTFIAQDGKYRVTIRPDENLSLRYKQGNLEVVDHEAASSRLYSSDYGGMRATIRNGNDMGVKLRSLGNQVRTETVAEAEKRDWIKNWLYRDSDGALLTARFRALKS
jgi:hypothetical protein